MIRNYKIRIHQLSLTFVSVTLFLYAIVAFKSLFLNSSLKSIVITLVGDDMFQIAIGLREIHMRPYLFVAFTLILPFVIFLCIDVVPLLPQLWQSKIKSFIFAQSNKRKGGSIALDTQIRLCDHTTQKSVKRISLYIRGLIAIALGLYLSAITLHKLFLWWIYPQEDMNELCDFSQFFRLQMRYHLGRTEKAKKLSEKELQNIDIMDNNFFRDVIWADDAFELAIVRNQSDTNYLILNDHDADFCVSEEVETLRLEFMRNLAFEQVQILAEQFSLLGLSEVDVDKEVNREFKNIIHITDALHVHNNYLKSKGVPPDTDRQFGRQKFLFMENTTAILRRIELAKSQKTFNKLFHYGNMTRSYPFLYERYRQSLHSKWDNRPDRHARVYLTSLLSLIKGYNGPLMLELDSCRGIAGCHDGNDRNRKLNPPSKMPKLKYSQGCNGYIWPVDVNAEEHLIDEYGDSWKTPQMMNSKFFCALSGNW